MPQYQMPRPSNSVSFPLAATAIAAQRMALAGSNLMADAVAITRLGLASLVVVLLLLRSLLGVFRGELRAPSA